MVWRKPVTVTDIPNSSIHPDEKDSTARWTCSRVMDWGVVILTLAGALVRFSSLGRQSLWYDEANGIRIARQAIGMIFVELQADASPPLYYLLLKAWISLWGTSAVAVRGLSALFGTLTIPIVYLAGKQLYDRRTGLAAAAILCISQMHVYYSQEARMYGLLVFLCTLLILFLSAALTTNTRRDWLWYALAAAAAVLTHNYGIFAVAAVLVCALWFTRQVPELRRSVLGATLAAGIIILPWFPFALKNQFWGTAIQGDWLPPFSFGMIVQSYVRLASMHMFTPGSVLFWVGHAGYLGCLFFAVRVLTWRLSNGEGRGECDDRSTMILLSAIVVGLGLPILVSLVRPIYLPHRYSIIALPAFVLLAGRGIVLAGRRRPVFAVLLGAAILVSSLAGLVWHFSYMVKARDRDIAAFLAGHFTAEDVLVVSPHWVAVTLDYYLPDLEHQLGYPMKALRERREHNEARERERRTPEEILRLTRESLTRKTGRVFFVRLPWFRDSMELRETLDRSFVLEKRMTLDRFEMSIYTQAIPSDKE